MKRIIKKILYCTLSIFLAFGCFGCSSIESKTDDEKFISNLSSGLEARWNITNNVDTDSMTASEEVDTYQSYVDAEKNALGKLKDYKFEDKKLKKLAEKYFNALDLQEEGVQYAAYEKSSNYDQYSEYEETWNYGFNQRIVLLKEFTDNYNLTVSSKYQTDLDDMLTEYKSAKKRVEIQEWVESIANSVQYVKDDSKSDEYSTFYSAIIENTTEYNIKGLTINLSFKNADGVVIDEGSDYIDVIKSKEKHQSSIFLGEANEQEVTSIDVAVEYYSNLQ